MKQASQTSLSLTSRVYSRSLFESTFSHILDPSDSLSSTDFSILLAYMSRDKPCLSANSTTVKFAAPDEANPAPITQQDSDIANLRTLITTLNAQVEGLTTKIAQLNIAIKQAISANQTIQAKSALKSRKLAESTLQARTATLSQLEEVYTSIENAADQVAIVRVMESSGSVLRNLHKEVGGVEGVEGVVDRLREEMENVDEVGRVINEANAGKIDEDEVDEELEELERAEREKKEAAERVEREKREAIERVEREKKEALERLEKEKKEQEEAEATENKLKELDEQLAVLDEQRRVAKEAADNHEEAQSSKEDSDRVVADASETA